MTTNYNYFELCRRSDNLVYQFDRTPLADGQIGYKRRDRDLWIVYRPTLGWVALHEESGLVSGRPWDVLPAARRLGQQEGGQVLCLRAGLLHAAALRPC